jgi:hypothetical protein
MSINNIISKKLNMARQELLDLGLRICMARRKQLKVKRDGL